MAVACADGAHPLGGGRAHPIGLRPRQWNPGGRPRSFATAWGCGDSGAGSLGALAAGRRLLRTPRGRIGGAAPLPVRSRKVVAPDRSIEAAPLFWGGALRGADLLPIFYWGRDRPNAMTYVV